MNLLNLLHCLLLAAFVFTGAGCQSLLGRSVELPAHREMAPLPRGTVCRIAVLPFQNDSGYPLADAMVQKVFTAQFQFSGNHLVIQEGDILKIYRQLRLLPGEIPTPEQMQIIADRVDAQLLVTGTVLEMREDRGKYGGIDPVAALEIQLRDPRSGESLWIVYHRRRGLDYQKAMHFGTIHSLPGLSRQMAEEIINLWKRKGFKQCDVSAQS